MNVRLITKVLHTLSLLSDEDYDLVLKLRALTEDERGLLMTVLEPQKPTTKKTGKKPSKKSERASGMAAQLNKQLNKRREQGRGAAESSSYNLCSHVFAEDGNRICDEVYESAVHHDTVYVTYHPFVSAAPPAPTRSPANGGAESIIQNSVDETVSADAATGGSSE